MMAPVGDDGAVLDALAVAAGRGDRLALEDLLTRIDDLVRVRCLRILPNRSDAEEAAQDALLAVSQRIDRFDGRARFTTWLYRVVSNSSFDTYRRLKRQAPPASDQMPSAVADERTSVIAGGRVDLLDALEAVDRRFIEPVLLRDLGGLSYQEIADAIDIPVGTVRSRVHEGRERLQGLLRARP
jgi:RNA polymerase sigma-70 factor (ECF subfamily)